ncbi:MULTISPECIES: flagellar biosynthesis protein FlhB [unclassified Guyparkeria]|uniref:flagellar biosynthesis protein FlhB n=1 Tax=unclassified Guyparkeria TaxID=2626246 RepID=UPI0007334054|nr:MULTISPECIES: flagellar biosynthesis protein FlhB [unclassified Guyparkeria]KTG16442.1 flagellar biosynthetic protein FlhB [Guyparkeria sp. XI15]OAE85382.1 flagellar biosynthetic protein FlhB [Guyparkeria sp. WRN-7]
MAENENGQEKTEEPTEKRLRDAREKGQVARSRELNSFLLTTGSAVVFLVFGGQMMLGLAEVVRDSFIISRADIFDQAAMFSRLANAFANGFLAFVPLFFATIVLAVVATLMVGGWNFSTQAMAPKLSKMNPLSGLKRIFGVQALMELGKTFAKFTLITAIGIAVFFAFDAEFLSLGLQPFDSALAHAGSLIAWGFLAVSLGLLLVALIDVPFQIWQHHKQQRMTLQEVKDEHKDTEGRPEIKQRIRQTQMQMSQRRMMEAVPEADVVVTNPTHYAVALKYDAEGIGAPMVVAKGVDEMALNLRKIAQANGVELFEAPPLARALYTHVEIDEVIPAALYTAVAQVLAYVYQLKEAARGAGPSPGRPEPEVPDDFAVPPNT